VFYSVLDVGYGMRIRIPIINKGVTSSQYARCGGIISKDGKWYAFSAAHAFEVCPSVATEPDDFEFELNDHSDTED
jgi:hypothetical protein